MDQKRRILVIAVCLAILCVVAYGLMRRFSIGPGSESRPAGVLRSVQTSRTDVYLYFSGKRGDYLVAEKRIMDMPKDPEQFGRTVIAALAKGPMAAGLVRTVPSGTACRAFYITGDKTAYVDLPSSIRDGYPGGSLCELLTVYSIVNSLVLNMDEVERVKILIDGREAETLAGHVDLRFPLAADMRMVR